MPWRTGTYKISSISSQSRRLSTNQHPAKAATAPGIITLPHLAILRILEVIMYYLILAPS